MEFIKGYNIFTQGVILSTFLLLILILVLLFLYLLNIKISKKNIKYIYSFSSGFIIVTAIVGQWVSSRTSLLEYFTKDSGTEHHNGLNSVQTFILMLILIFGVTIGTLIGFLIKKYSTKISHNHSVIHNKEHNHSHLMDTKSEQMQEIKKSKNSIIYMVLTHRLPAGLILGILLVNVNKNTPDVFSFGALLAFILHTIPEIIIIYFSRLENGNTKKQALKFSLLTNLIIIPFIFIGILMAKYAKLESNSTYWIIPILLIISGVVMIWGAIFELGPTFLHLDNDRQTYKIILWFIIGLSLSMMIQFVHIH